MKKRMQLNFMAIAMISMIAVLLLTTVVFYNLFQNEVIENLHTCADMLGEDLVNYKDTDRIISKKKVDNIRVTLIDKDGVVLADSDVNADVLGNHKERPEVKEAIEKGSGKSIRTSNTLSHASYYYAIRLSNGNILRLAKESQSFISFLIRFFCLWCLSFYQDYLRKVLLNRLKCLQRTWIARNWQPVTKN